jgi:hypothetical protein
MLEIPRIGRLLGRRGVSEAKRRAGVDEATRRLLLGFVVPTWIGAGVADRACHRATDIEHTAGRRESVIHAAMMTQAGIPALLGLLFEINAGVLTTTLAALESHQVTAVWYVPYWRIGDHGADRSALRQRAMALPVSNAGGQTSRAIAAFPEPVAQMGVLPPCRLAAAF